MGTAEVGECTEEQLEWEAEFNENNREQVPERRSRMASIIENDLQNEERVPDKIKLDIYDVILAGVVNGEG